LKRIVSIVILFCVMFCGISAFAETPTYDDIENHWAEKVIEKWSFYEIINGYGKSFLPDNNITRGEFATVLNRVFCYDDPSGNPFDDLGVIYYTKHILCLNKQGIMNGFNNRIRPDDYITREEAGAMLFKALALTEENNSVKKFKDEEEISEWAKPYITTLADKGYLTGSNGYLRPGDNITRAEAVTLMDNCISLLREDSEGFDSEKTCIISGDKLTLKECRFSGDVFIAGNAGGIVFDNVSINGTLYVLSKLEKCVTLKECEINNKNALYGDDVFNKVVKNAEASETKNLQDEETIIIPSAGNREDDEAPDEHKPVIETTLKDGAVYKNSKMVFDVFAKDYEGAKTECRVSVNGINVEPTWNDETKTSFTLEFQDSGEYVVEITATDAGGISQTKTYNIIYEMAEYGEPIGKATVCIEAFTVGGGYIVAPVEIDVLEGVNCAYLLDEFLSDNNLSYMSTGSLDGGFYLATVSDIPEFTPVICETLLSALTDAGFDIQLESYTPNELSEFDFTQGSGWMYCVNGIFPNVGFSEYYLQDGDVMRIQFTLAYGSDIGGASGAGYSYAGDFYEMVNRDELTKIISDIGVENCSEYMELISKPDLTEDELSDLLNQLR